MLKAKFVALSAVLAAVSLSAVAAGTASADGHYGNLKITVLGFNAHGTDTNANRNEEYIWLTNKTAGDLDVNNWTVSDSFGGPNATKFTTSNLPKCQLPGADASCTKLAAGESVIVYTGAGHDTTPTNNVQAIYKNYHHYLNNGGDSVTVRDAAHGFVDKLAYSDFGVNPTP